MSSEKYDFTEGGLIVMTQLPGMADETYPLFLDATAVRESKDDDEREVRARRLLEILVESGIGYERSEDGKVTNDLEINIGFQRRGYGVFGMNANILRPTWSDDISSAVATSAMRKMAYDLGTYKDKDIPGMVYASVSRPHGITLETNPAASSSMDTDGQDYSPTSERVELYAHNLYTHEMQLICIAGIIALAKAR